MRISLNERLRSVLLAAASVVALSSVGCGSQPAPIRTAMIDLTAESRRIVDRDGPFGLVSVVAHHQATSIGGNLIMPDVGQLYRFPSGADVTTAIGIAEMQSYRCIGETAAPPPGVVAEVRLRLERTDLASSVAAQRLLEVAQIERSLKGNEPTFDLEALRVARTRLHQAEERLVEAKERLMEIASTPGIVIARWRIGDASGMAVEVGGVATARAESVGGRSGYVVLGGLRSVSIAFGEDFWRMIGNLRPGEARNLHRIGIVTSVLQAREVAYVSDSGARRAMHLALAVDAASIQLSQFDRGRLAAYWEWIEKYGNSGSLGVIKWCREPFCCVCALNLPELADDGDRVLQLALGARYPATMDVPFAGWRTVAANVMHLRRGIDWTRLAAEYGEPATDPETGRHLRIPAPNCPRCGTEGDLPSVGVGGARPGSTPL